MFKVPECNSETADDRKKADQGFVERFSTSGLSLAQVPSATCHRVGTRSAEKCRPLKVCFSTVAEKRLFLSNLKELKGKDEFKDVSVSHDMCEEDKLEKKKLLKEAYQKNQADTSKNFTFKVRGRPGEMYIAKISNTQ